MTKHRTITGFVAVALLAVVATGVTMRSHSPWLDGIVVSGATLLKGFSVGPNTVPTANFEDRWSAMTAPPQASR
jgi:hypothetical protein